MMVIRSFIIVSMAMFIIAICSNTAQCITYTESQYQKMIDGSCSPVDFIGQENYDKQCPYGDVYVMDVIDSYGLQKVIGQYYDCINPTKNGWIVKNFNMTTLKWDEKIILNNKELYRMFTMDGELINNNGKVKIIENDIDIEFENLR